MNKLISALLRQVFLVSAKEFDNKEKWTKVMKKAITSKVPVEIVELSPDALKTLVGQIGIVGRLDRFVYAVLYLKTMALLREVARYRIQLSPLTSQLEDVLAKQKQMERDIAQTLKLAGTETLDELLELFTLWGKPEAISAIKRMIPNIEEVRTTALELQKMIEDEKRKESKAQEEAFQEFMRLMVLEIGAAAQNRFTPVSILRHAVRRLLGMANTKQLHEIQDTIELYFDNPQHVSNVKLLAYHKN